MLLCIERYIRTQFGGFHGQFRVFIQYCSSSHQHCIQARTYMVHPGFVSLEGNGGAFACSLVDLAIRALMAILTIMCDRFIVDILITFSALFV